MKITMAQTKFGQRASGRLAGRMSGGALCLLAAGALAGACRGSDTTNPPVTTDSGPGVTDAVTDAGNMPPTDGGPTGTDGGQPVTDGGRDATTPPTDVPSTGVSMAVLTNPTAAGHPAARAVVTVTDTNLVMLSPRLFISGPSTTNHCSYAAWVGTSTGGDYSAIELFESLPAAPAADGGTADCFAASVVGNIPADIAIGDTLSALRGTNDPYCPRGSMCPAGTSAEFNVGAASSGIVTVSGHGGMVPAPTMVHVMDVAGMGTTLGSRDIALQGSLVQLSGTFLQTAPASTNHDNMVVTESAAAGSPGMTVLVGKYRGVTCQRTALGAAALGSPVGTVVGVLEYSFGNWLIQPRQASDLPGVTCTVMPDAGTRDGGASDATATDATATDVPAGDAH